MAYTGPSYQKNRIPGVLYAEDEPAVDVGGFLARTFPAPPPGGFPVPEYKVPSRQAVANAAGAPRKPEVRPAVSADAETTAAAARATAEVKAREKAHNEALAAAAAAREQTSETTVEQPRRGFDTVMVEGKPVIATPDRARALVEQGGRYRAPKEPMPYPAAGGGAALTKAAGGGTPGGGFVQANVGPRPFSEQLIGLEPPPESALLSAPGTGWTFRGGYVETGKPGPREGTRRLSGIEQAVARREWLEGRRREEASLETQDVEQAAERAKAEQAIKYAGLDPLAMAKLQAESRYGSEAIRQRAQAGARQQAFLQAVQLYQAALNAEDPAQKQQLMRMAENLANILMGQRVGQSNDMLSMLLGMGGMGMGAPVGAAGVPEQK